MPGSTKSSVNLAWPVIRRGSSRRLIGEPKMRAPMFGLLYAFAMRPAASLTAATMFW